jgi:hypothetical protein
MQNITNYCVLIRIIPITTCKYLFFFNLCTKLDLLAENTHIAYFMSRMTLKLVNTDSQGTNELMNVRNLMNVMNGMNLINITYKKNS